MKFIIDIRETNTSTKQLKLKLYDAVSCKTPSNGEFRYIYTVISAILII